MSPDKYTMYYFGYLANCFHNSCVANTLAGFPFKEKDTELLHRAANIANPPQKKNLASQLLLYHRDM